MAPTLRFAIRVCQLSLLGVALATATLGAQSPALPPQDLNTNFVGNWVGQLEYRDYGTNERVFLPTWLRITETSDHRALELSYVYDDGPSKTVREHVTLELDAAMHRATLTDHDETQKGKTTSQTFAVSGLDEFSKTGRGVLRLTGPGLDDNKHVDVRVTLTLRRNLYSYRKEIRPAGNTDEDAYEFRDGYVFTRAEGPAAP
jgi:hypothetical protein